MAHFSKLKSLLFLSMLVFALRATGQTPAAPASCTTVIGSPANGTSHYITISWASVSGATAYVLEYSYDGTTWNTLDSADITTYNHDAGNTGNIPVYYQVKAFENGNESGWTPCTPYPIYTACDFPALLTLSNAGAYSMSITVPAESPTPNATGTTYAIYCTSTGQYVQANGTLGANAVYQTRPAWGTITVTGLTVSTNYCFYSIAMNENGNTQIAPGSTISAVETFDASGSLNTSTNGVTNAYWTPPQPTSYPSRLTWLSTGGCSGGTGAGNVGFSGEFTNYFGSFLRTPAINCTGNSTVVLTCDITNSYIASHIVSTPTDCDAINFDMWVNNNYYNASSIKINGVEVSHVDGNGIWLEFDTARSCVEVEATYDLASYSNISAVLFYINPQDPYNDSYAYNVGIDNVGISAGAASACLSTTACTAATISTNPSNTTACSGSNASFTVATSGAVASYQWQLSTNGGSTWNNVTSGGIYTNATSATLDITGVTSALSTYQYRCQVTGSCSGTPTSTGAVLTVDSLPGSAGSVSGTPGVCQSQNGVVYSVGAVTGATGYTWSLPTGASIASGSGTNSITVDYDASAVSGNIIVTPTNTCGNGTASAAFALTVNQLPAQPDAINGVSSSCADVAQTYSISAVNGATSYTWTIPGGWSGSSTTNSITVTPSSSGGNLSVTANNGCGSSAAQTLGITITSVPATPSSVIGSSVVCDGISSSYSVNAVSGATSYTWTLPGGWSGSSTTSSITVTPSSSGGSITVTANNTCGQSSAQSLSVSLGTVPSTPGSITGSSTACSGESLTYSVAPAAGATSYTWTLPSGWTGTSTADTIAVTAGSNAGTISVKANNGCGSSGSNSITISSGAVPAMPGAISGTDTVCTGSSASYGVAIVTGATSYSWTLPNGWSGTSTTNTITANPGNSSGNIIVTADNSCGSSQAQSLGVVGLSVPGTPVAIEGPDSVCTGSSAVFSISNVNGVASYNWILPNGWSGSSNTALVSATAGSTDGNILVSASNRCGTSSAQSKSVSANPLPEVSFNYDGGPICSNASPVVLNMGTPTGGIYSGTGISGGAFNPSVGPGTYALVYTVVDVQGCSNSDSAIFTVQTCNSILALNQDVDLLVFPNPFNDNISLQWSSNTQAGYAVMYDFSGREVLRTELPQSSNSCNIHTGSLAAGGYLLQVITSTGTGMGWKKVVKVD